MAKGKERPYDASDLKELMDNVGGWAHNWNDVLRYLEGPAVKDVNFTRDEVPAMIHDIEKLKQQGAAFTYDYRNVWHDITGQSTKDLPPPTGIKKPLTNPIELEDKYLHGLDFPAQKGDVIRTAESHHAPQRVMEVLKKLEPKEYRDMNTLLEAVGDLTWDHD